MIYFSRTSNVSMLTVWCNSQDETTLIWYSHGEERNLKLSSVSRIIPGQRTVSNAVDWELTNSFYVWHSFNTLLYNVLPRLPICKKQKRLRFHLFVIVYRLFLEDICALKKIIYHFHFYTITVKDLLIWLVKWDYSV